MIVLLCLALCRLRSTNTPRAWLTPTMQPTVLFLALPFIALKGVYRKIQRRNNEPAVLERMQLHPRRRNDLHHLLHPVILVEQWDTPRLTYVDSMPLSNQRLTVAIKVRQED